MAQIPSTNSRDEETIRSFPAYLGNGFPGYIVDFLGVKTRLNYIAGMDHLSGHVEGHPVPWNFHANSIEWAGVLRAASEAEDSFTAMELGAGWGPWLVTGAAAARQCGIQTIHLIGVEGSKSHCDYMRLHLQDNGYNPDNHTLVHGVAGSYDGIAKFPILADPAASWGAEARFEKVPIPPSLYRRSGRKVKHLLRALAGRKQPLLPGPAMESVTCYSMETLLRSHPRVDLVHVDIQGAEFEVIASGRDVLKEKVRRLVVGTHGRTIEERLMGELAPQGWELESEEACLFEQRGDNVYLFRDGCQVWRNRRWAAQSGVAPASRAA